MWAAQGSGPSGPTAEPVPSPSMSLDFEPQYEAVSAAPSNGQQVRRVLPTPRTVVIGSARHHEGNVCMAL